MANPAEERLRALYRNKPSDEIAALLGRQEVFIRCMGKDHTEELYRKRNCLFSELRSRRIFYNLKGLMTYCGPAPGTLVEGSSVYPLKTHKKTCMFPRPMSPLALTPRPIVATTAMALNVSQHSSSKSQVDSMPMPRVIPTSMPQMTSTSTNSMISIPEHPIVLHVPPIISRPMHSNISTPRHPIIIQMPPNPESMHSNSVAPQISTPMQSTISTPRHPVVLQVPQSFDSIHSNSMPPPILRPTHSSMSTTRPRIVLQVPPNQESMNPNSMPPQILRPTHSGMSTTRPPVVFQDPQSSRFIHSNSMLPQISRPMHSSMSTTRPRIVLQVPPNQGSMNPNFMPPHISKPTHSGMSMARPPNPGSMNLNSLPPQISRPMHSIMSTDRPPVVLQIPQSSGSIHSNSMPPQISRPTHSTMSTPRPSIVFQLPPNPESLDLNSIPSITSRPMQSVISTPMPSNPRHMVSNSVSGLTSMCMPPVASRVSSSANSATMVAYPNSSQTLNPMCRMPSMPMPSIVLEPRGAMVSKLRHSIISKTISPTTSTFIYPGSSISASMLSRTISPMTSRPLMFPPPVRPPKVRRFQNHPASSSSSIRASCRTPPMDQVYQLLPLPPGCFINSMSPRCSNPSISQMASVPSIPSQPPLPPMRPIYPMPPMSPVGVIPPNTFIYPVQSMPFNSRSDSMIPNENISLMPISMPPVVPTSSFPNFSHNPILPVPPNYNPTSSKVARPRLQHHRSSVSPYRDSSDHLTRVSSHIYFTGSFANKLSQNPPVAHQDNKYGLEAGLLVPTETVAGATNRQVNDIAPLNLSHK